MWFLLISLVLAVVFCVGVALAMDRWFLFRVGVCGMVVVVLAANVGDFWKLLKLLARKMNSSSQRWMLKKWGFYKNQKVGESGRTELNN